MGCGKIIDLTVLSNSQLWFFIILIFFMTLIVYETKNVVMALIPAVGLVSWASIGGYIPLWYLFVILLITSLGITVVYVVPVIRSG